MSVLETIYIQFKSDSKDVKKGAQAARKSTAELEKGLLDTKGAAVSMGKSFGDSILSAQRNISAMLTVGALTARTLREAGQAEQLGRFAERLGQDAEQVNRWGKMVEQTGGSAGGFRATLAGLINTLTEFEITGGGAASEVFARLGVNAFNANGQLKDTFDLLPEIADAFQRLSSTEAANLGAKLGLDNATILLLQRGRSEIEQLTARQQYLGIVTAEDTELAEAFGRAWRDTRTALGSFARTIGFTLLPILTDAQSIIQDTFVFLRENQDFIGDIFKSAAAVIGTVYLPVMVKAGLATIVAFLPFILIGAAIAALALAWNDLNAYMEGGDSIIGRLIERFPIVGESIGKVAEMIKTLKENISEFFNSLNDYFTGNIGRSFNQFLSLVGLQEEQQPLRQQPQDITGGAAGGGNTQADLPPMAREPFTGEETPQAPQAPQAPETPETPEPSTLPYSPVDHLPRLPRLPNIITPEIQQNFSQVGEMAAAINNTTTTTNSSTENSVNIGDINISMAGGDPADIANHLEEELNRAMAQMATGING